MVRTKADSCPAAGRKVVAARAPRKNVGGSSSSAGCSSSANLGASPAGKYAGGNPVCPRPTPDWQKGIGTFFQSKPGNEENQEPGEEAGCSGSSSSCETNVGGSASSSSTPSKSKSSSGPSGSKSSTAGPSRSQDDCGEEDNSGLRELPSS
ncbi:PCNA-associated factor-like isoform X2 [Littorina saxatilis]